MQKKIRIPKKQIIAINTRFVYFLQNGKVFKGNRKIRGHGNRLTSKESTVNPFVVKDSIKKIETIYKTCDTKLIKILKRHGVKVI